MIGFLRLMLYGFIALTLLYALVSVYARSLRREALEKEWDANPPEGTGAAERSAYIEAGMEAYRHSLRRRLIWLVYIIPLVALVVLNYINTFT